MTDSPLLGITGWGRNIREAFAKGTAEGMPAVRRVARQMALALAEDKAIRATRHADWFCSLPWYRQWWAMVRGR